MSSREFESPPSLSPDQSPPSPPDESFDPSSTFLSPTNDESRANPPSRSNSSPSSHSHSSHHKSSHSLKSPPPLPDSDGRGKDPYGNRAAIGAGIGIGLIVFIWVIICILRTRRKKREEKYFYYGEGKGGDNYNAGKYPNSYSGQKEDNVKMNQQNGWYARAPSQLRIDNDSGYNFSQMNSPLPPPPPPPPPTSGGTFTYEELESATAGFDENNLLGQGGFGYVYKGILPSGKEVAVKSLKENSGQGEQEFQTEVDIIGRVHHRHLVSLVGYCISGRKRLLVYEFVPNMTLEYHLHGKVMPTMDWSTRLRIAIGSGRGLTYLHEECAQRIIHRDIKASNILLDLNFEPKVADFGLAKLTTDNNTHVSTRVMGTFGYLAPEYASSGRLTEKSDVYSFGVMLLELMTGKSAAGGISSYDDGLVDWARPLLNIGLQNGNFRELVDPFLEGNYNEQEFVRMARCAIAGIRHSSKKRPKMSQIVKVLEGVLPVEELSIQ